MDTYHERSTWPIWFHVLFGLLACVVPVALVISGEWIGVVVALIFGGIWYRFAWVEIRISQQGVEYGFRGLNNHVPWERMRSIEAEKYPFRRYLGWGWRIGGRRDRAYSLIGPSHGVRIRFEDERGRDWSIFLSSRDPEAAVRAAKRKLS
ncbi:MAG: hypothetical protein ACYTEG_09455 [Planctomycetota bacterium]|jgi:hypothetical protein